MNYYVGACAPSNEKVTDPLRRRRQKHGLHRSTTQRLRCFLQLIWVGQGQNPEDLPGIEEGLA